MTRETARKSGPQLPEELLRDLIRFDTTNPPGNEAACIEYVADVLRRAGMEPVVRGRTPRRTNAVARLAGRAEAPPLLMYGHVDVVTTAGQRWSVDPFAGKMEGGFVWGRGALDMKGGLAMMLSALLRARREGLVPAGDVIFAALSDEEAGGAYGAGYLVREHGGLFDGARYAIGEFGGFPMYFGGRKFYAVQVSEKQVCWMKAAVRGPGGHGALPLRGGAMARLSAFLRRLDEERLPVHLDPTVERMLRTICEEIPPSERAIFERLLDPREADAALDEMGDRGLMFDAMLHNTVNATVVRGGDKVNVVPSEIGLELDGRLLPGFGPDDLLSEIRSVAGSGVEIEVARFEKGPDAADMALFDTLAGILEEADPGARAMPLLLMGCTDARFFAELGIQSYGFIPMNLPEEFDFTRLVHAADERVPVEALRFGADAIFELIRRYGG